ncbi:MAG: Homoserine kinase [Parcubacteria group bacterium GW2011_GWC2_39_14]|nr:MAG: Homoserine kinase [Parcubacteria group bacterium GW2011_GWC2_39_14]KKR54332.1 MAG: Homoserine kinase [Parcubacteria group bacterium GW2011_GWA2_40_23]
MKINNQTIKQIINKISSEKVISIQPLEKNSKRNYLVETNIGNFVFSFYSDGPRYRTLGELKAQQELSDYLLSKKLPVAKIISIFKLKDEKTNILIKKYIVGRSKSTPTKAELSQFAKMFGQFHKLTQNFKTKNKFQHHWDLQSTLRHADELKHEFPKDKFLLKIQSELKKIEIPNKLPSGIIHEDLGRRHVLWNRTKIVGFIDFERSYYAPLVYDLGQSVRGWCFYSNWQKWCNKKLTNLLKFYSTQRKITVEEKKYLFDAIKFAVIERALSFYIKYLRQKDKSAKEYTKHSLNYLLPLLEKKKTKIQSIINAA